MTLGTHPPNNTNVTKENKDREHKCHFELLREITNYSLSHMDGDFYV